MEEVTAYLHPNGSGQWVACHKHGRLLTFGYGATEEQARNDLDRQLESTGDLNAFMKLLDEEMDKCDIEEARQ